MANACTAAVLCWPRVFRCWIRWSLKTSGSHLSCAPFKEIHLLYVGYSRKPLILPHSMTLLSRCRGRAVRKTAVEGMYFRNAIIYYSLENPLWYFYSLPYSNFLNQNFFKTKSQTVLMNRSFILVGNFGSLVLSRCDCNLSFTLSRCSVFCGLFRVHLFLKDTVKIVQRNFGTGLFMGHTEVGAMNQT